MLLGHMLPTATITIENHRVSILQNLRITGPVLLEVDGGIYHISHVLVELLCEKQTACPVLMSGVAMAAFTRKEDNLLLR